MSAELFPPIPTPLAHRWRQFKTTRLPWVAFVAALGTTVWLWRLNQPSGPGMRTNEGLIADVVGIEAGNLNEAATHDARVTAEVNETNQLWFLGLARSSGRRTAER